MQHFANSLRSLVARNQPKLTLSVLSNFFSNEMPHLHDAAVLLQANLAQVERDIATGVISRSDARQNLAQINAGLLHLIGDVSRHQGDEMAAFERAKQVETAFHEQELVLAPAQSNRTLLWAGVVGALIIAGFLAWQLSNSTQTTRAKVSSKTEQTTDRPKNLAEQKSEYDAWRHKAEDLAKQNQWQQAYNALNNAFGLGYDNAALFNQRADLLLHLGRYAEARNDARQAVMLDPDGCFPYVTLAQAQAQLGDLEDFYQKIEIALRKHCEVWKYTEQIGIAKFKNQPRFKRLMAMYQGR